MCCCSWFSGVSLSSAREPRAIAREGKVHMTVIGMIVLALMVYLGYVLVKPEKF
ncbi:potassium-transporting ATPase subunit F [Paenibacillus illinoisensis]|nr:potassium-transporting ATPase subunit F [Paenibacillus illinoisensis]